MAFDIFGLTTNKVSLVTKDKTPAVQKATTKFSMFKFMEKAPKYDVARLEKIQAILKSE